jgi:hypothetical protein
MSDPILSHTTTNQYVAAKATVMVDWTILSPTFLSAVVDWAGAIVTVFAVGSGHSTKDTQGRREEHR